MLFAGIALALSGFVLAVPALYLVDLPAWVFQGALWSAEAGSTRATPWAQVSYPVPNALSTLLPALLLTIVGPVWAGKLIGVVLIAGGFVAAWMLARASGAEDTWANAAVLASCLVVSSSFWNGYVGFQLGVVGLMVALATWIRGSMPPLAVAGASVALFFAHAVPFAAFALGVGLDALRGRKGRELAALVPSTVLTIWYVAARSDAPGEGFDVAEGVANVGQAIAYKAYTILKLGPFQHPVDLDGRGTLTGMPTLYWIAVALSGLFIAGLAVALVRGTARMESGARRQVAVYGWTLVLAALLLPAFALNVVNPGERVLVIGAVVLLGAVPVDRRWMKVLGLVALAFMANDIASLALQRHEIPAEERAAIYTDRAARESSAPATQPDLSDKASSAVRLRALSLLSHPAYLHSDLYDATERQDWNRWSFSTGLLRPPGHAPP